MRAAWLLLLLAAGTARAEELLERPRPRQGYYLALGAYSSVVVGREDAKTQGPMVGYGASLNLGQLLKPRLGLGLAIDLGGGSGGGQSSRFFGLGLAGQVELATNLALHASVGLGVVSVEDPEDEDISGVTSAAYTLGVTYDWFPWSRGSGGWAITPSVFVRAVPGGDSAFVTLVGVRVTRWTGLPRNQLELPPDEAYRR